MGKILRTLSDYRRYRIGLLGKCSACRGFFSIDITSAIAVLPPQAEQADLNGKARCTRCGNGTATRTYPTLDYKEGQRDKTKRPAIHFAGLIQDYEDGIDPEH